MSPGATTRSASWPSMSSPRSCRGPPAPSSRRCCCWRSRPRARRSPRRPAGATTSPASCWVTTLNAGIISTSSPIFVALAASALLGDRLSGRVWVGIGLSVAAVVLTVAKGSLATLLSLSMNRGDLIILLSQTAASTLPPRTSSPPARWCRSRSPSTARGRRRGGRRWAGRSCSTQRGRSRSAVCGSISRAPRPRTDGHLPEPDALRGDRAGVGAAGRGRARLPTWSAPPSSSRAWC